MITTWRIADDDLKNMLIVKSVKLKYLSYNLKNEHNSSAIRILNVLSLIFLKFVLTQVALSLQWEAEIHIYDIFFKLIQQRVDWRQL